MDDSELGLRDYLRVVRKRLWTVVAAVTVALVGTAVYTWKTVPVYRATSTLLIERSSPGAPTLDELYKSGGMEGDSYATEIKLMLSRAFAEKVVARLAAQAGNPLAGKPDAAAYVQGLLKVVTLEGTRILSVATEGPEPELITKINHAVIDGYIEEALSRRVNEVRNLSAQLAKEAEDLHRKLDEGEKALQEFKVKNNLPMLGEQMNLVVTKLDELASAVTAFEKERRALEVVLDGVKNSAPDDPRLLGLPEIQGSSGFAALRAEETKTLEECNELAARYRAKHPKMLAVQARLDTVRKALAALVREVLGGIGARCEAAKLGEQKARQALEEQTRTKLAMDSLSPRYAALQREVESTRALYQNLVKRIQEATVTSAIDANSMSVVDRATVPTVPFKPQPLVNLGLALLAGLALGIGLALLVEHLDNSLKSPEEVDLFLKLPYLGHVPIMPGRQAEKDRDRIAQADARSRIAEAFRGIRTSVLYSAPAGAAIRSALVVSAGPREGKTTTSINLAIAMAQAGHRVLLIDADLRRPRIHSSFDLGTEVGLSSLLVGEAELDAAVRESGVDRLSILPSGPIPPNPSELLGSQGMREVLARARERFDRVLLDTPPVLAVTDACVLGPLVEGVILVVRAAHTGRDVVARGRDLLRGTQSRILGVVLNGVAAGQAGYHYGGYEYAYTHEAEEGGAAKPAKPANPAVLPGAKV